MRLVDSALGSLDPSILVPRYDRSRLRPGIVHIGVGNFHRAHQSWYLHRLFQAGLDLDWAIVGAGVRPYDASMQLKLRAQDYLTTLVVREPGESSAEVVGSMIDYLPVEPGNGALIRQMTAPEIRIVSLTVTEGGYYADPATGAFNARHPDIHHDVDNPDSPNTAFGAMVAALRQRRARGVGPFTGQSCDNLQGNGRMLRQAVVSLAALTDPELAVWIDTHCTFPNSMVDCIVPATGPKELALASELGIDDAAPVTHEKFRQWVIEDRFCAGRPAWEKVGAAFTDAVHDYELMKIRILNGGHQLVANAGEVCGIKTIADCMADPAIRAYVGKVTHEEIVPHVRPVEQFKPDEYAQLIARRFSNPLIVDTTRRVAFDGSSRHPGFLIPSIRDGLRTDGSVRGLALAEAIWARYCQGTREDGSTIEPNDPNWEQLMQSARAARADPARWLRLRQFYGELGDEPRFASAFAHWLELINHRGVRPALREFLGD
ncbi:MAG: Mannitol 2-dehydrogenase [Pseudomonadota bacterium]|jgi:mannitol 2-dehydrogenase